MMITVFNKVWNIYKTDHLMLHHYKKA